MRQTRTEKVPKNLASYFKVGALAERFDTDREQIHRWIRTGELGPVIRVGRLIRVSPAALAEFERKHTVSGGR